MSREKMIGMSMRSVRIKLPVQATSAIRHAIEHSFIGNEGEIKVLRDCYASLTPREQEVMKLVVSGMLYKQGGLKLGISEITVKAHRPK